MVSRCHAVLVGNRQHIGNDFHVAMAVGTKTAPGGDAVVVDNAADQNLSEPGRSRLAKERCETNPGASVVGVTPFGRGES